MISVKIGNMFDSQSQTLVNTVNCVGVMGKGIALEFKKRYPDMFEDYVKRCKNDEVRLGQPYLYRQLIAPWILNFPTKEHWRSVSRLRDIISGLDYLRTHYRDWGITSLAVPPLGCGLGDLEWRVVGPTLFRYLKTLDIPVELFAPFDTPHAELRPEFLDAASDASKAQGAQSAQYKIEPAWIAIIEILSRIEKEPYHWQIGRTAFQKIVYFATEAGIPTKLAFKRGSFGPYSPDLKRRIAALVNNGLVEEKPLGKMFAIYVGKTYWDARRAYEHSISAWTPVIEKVSDLFMRMNTQQAEIAATVHFAYLELKDHSSRTPQELEVLDHVLAWKQKRRPPLDRTEIAGSIRNLAGLGWISPEPSSDLPSTEESSLIA